VIHGNEASSSELPRVSLANDQSTIPAVTRQHIIRTSVLRARLCNCSGTSLLTAGHRPVFVLRLHYILLQVNINRANDSSDRARCAATGTVGGSDS
jgi:hypothetical protein